MAKGTRSVLAVSAAWGDVMRFIELLGQEVIPALHEVRLQPYA